MKKKIILISTIFTIVIIVIFSFFIILLKNNGEKENINNEENIPKEDIKKEPTEEEIKLEQLNNINKQLSFFKIEKLDEYIEYKKIMTNLSDEQIVVNVNIGLNKPFYSDTNKILNESSLTALVNKYNYLDGSYIPEDLEVIDSKYSSGLKELRHEARLAFEQLASDARVQGYNIIAVSTYRSYNYQKNLYNNYATTDGIEKADTYSARAGYSEHQTGLAVDVANLIKGYTTFGDTPEFTWMKNNAYKYGFILRYTKEAEPITGYMNEPWHYRYVGPDIAKYIQENPMTYEEYYARFLDK